MKHYYVLLFLSTILSACESKNIFQDNPIIHVTNFQDEVQIIGKQKDIAPIGTLGLHIIDTFIISTQSNLPEYLGVYQKEDGKKIKDLLPIGRGPNEFLDFTFKGQYCKNKEEIKLYFSDCNKGYFYELNLTQTLQQDTLHISKISRIPYRSFPTFATDSFYISKTYIPANHK